MSVRHIENCLLSLSIPLARLFSEKATRATVWKDRLEGTEQCM